MNPARSGPRPGLLALGGWRIGLLLFPALVALVPFAPFAEANYLGNFHGAGGSASTFATRWATWDSQHYLFLAQHGYFAGHVSSAFWPLWPGLVGAASRLAAAPPLGTALLLANLLAVLATVGLRYLVRGRSAEVGDAGADPERPDRVARLSVLLFLAFPSAFFLGLPYSESLFLALAVGLFLALERQRLGWAALAAFALPLARPVGLFILLPLLHFAFGRSLQRLKARVRPSRLGLALLLLAPLAGAATYFGIHRLATGDAAGAFGVRGVFASGQSLARLVDLPSFLRALVAVDGWHSVTGSLLDRLLFLVVVAALPWLFRHERLMFWYALPMTLVPAFSLHFMAFNRYALVLFPVFRVGAEALVAADRALLRRGVLALSFALQLWLYARHSLNLWAG